MAHGLDHANAVSPENYFQKKKWNLVEMSDNDWRPDLNTAWGSQQTKISLGKRCSAVALLPE